MRILVDGLEHSLTNMGDVAMLQVAVARLRQYWPHVTIDAIVDAPDRLKRYCPGVRAISWHGYRTWLNESRAAVGGRIYNALPVPGARRLSKLEMRIRHHCPDLNRLLVLARLKRRRVDTAGMEAFLESVTGADLVVVSGGGGVADVFKGWAVDVLESLWMAIRRETPTAMLSQGFGPLADPGLRATAKRVLPSVNLIAVREQKIGPELLRSLHVPDDRIVVTGDDAIELAYEARGTHRGTAIGVNLRVAKYSGVAAATVTVLRQLLHGAAARHGAELVAVPISFKEHESDLQSIQRLCNADGDAQNRRQDLDSPASVIEQVKRCRVVVTGSYHAAVFAVSLGIPVICLVQSDYYASKFLGLKDQFGQGCEIVSLNDDQLPNRLTAGIADAWTSGDDVMPTLLDAARRQVRLGHEYYRRVAELVTSRQGRLR